MTKAFAPKIISANDLLTGQTIYLSGDHWSSDIADATVAGDAAGAEQLLAVAASQPQIAVGPYLVDVIGEAGSADPAPARYRELIRVTGPTVGALNPDFAGVGRAA